jgi:hypothetical protein
MAQAGSSDSDRKWIEESPAKHWAFLFHLRLRILVLGLVSASLNSGIGA